MTATTTIPLETSTIGCSFKDMDGELNEELEAVLNAYVGRLCEFINTNAQRTHDLKDEEFKGVFRLDCPISGTAWEVSQQIDYKLNDMIELCLQDMWAHGKVSTAIYDYGKTLSTTLYVGRH